MPTDKSISHRALIFAGLATGQAQVKGLLHSADVRSSLRCMQKLGLGIRQNATGLLLTGMGGRLSEPQDILDCGNSGTTMRLLCGLLAGLDGHSVLTGDASLRRRPMARVCDPLRSLGARFDGRQGGRMAPLSIRGKRPLCGGRIVSPIASAQVKSALLLAGLQAQGPLTVSEPSLSRDHSERLLAAMGADLHRVLDADGRHQVTVTAGAPLHMVDIDIPGDISSAAFLLVAAALVPGSLLELDQVGTNHSRSGILDVLDAMGAGVAQQDGRVVGGEARATLIARSADLC
ncbi:MAG: 3-phosphoshikimate 1-carboxyvinyltransferase, partial [Oligoflexia bacterium]|nr:3-phosphoshikimate 1-carboxyvinyltransferase [Oligoflexia bacterium]